MFTGCEIRRDTTYKFCDEEINEFLIKKEKEIEQVVKEAKITFSDSLSYDEQYVFTADEGWVYRLSAIDPVTNYPYANKILTKDEFNSKNIKKILTTHNRWTRDWNNHYRWCNSISINY